MDEAVDMIGLCRERLVIGFERLDIEIESIEDAPQAAQSVNRSGMHP